MSYSDPPPGRRPVIAGLCDDLAHEFSLSPTLVRVVVLVCAVLPTGLTYMICAWLADRRQTATGWYGAGTQGQATPSPALLPVVQRLRALETRLSGMEAFVASRDFELHKGFRNIRS